jgi:hypothetical protein
MDPFGSAAVIARLIFSAVKRKRLLAILVGQGRQESYYQV